MFRIIHTSDWHLGHTLHEISREEEHAHFLRWLLETVDRTSADALLVAGDVFDTANPPASAQRQLYTVLAEARRRFPSLGIVVTGGNHDSATRLDAPEPLFQDLRVHVVGGLTRAADLSLEVDRAIVPLMNSGGSVAAWVAAVPYLRPCDLDPVVGGKDVIVEGVRRVYAKVLDAIRARRQPGQALVAMGHAYMTGTTLSELSERKIQSGNQSALPVDIFPDDLAYVALGHLHLAQTVERQSVRYCGSPIPLSMTEASYPHQVLVVDLEGEKLVQVHEERIPRTVDLRRVPQDGPRPLTDVLEQLAQLEPCRDGRPEWQRAYLEVQVLLEGEDPQVRAKVEAAVVDKEPRLVKVSIFKGGDGAALADVLPQHRLEDLSAEDVVKRLHEREHGTPCPPDLLAALNELIEAVQQEDPA